MSMYAGGFTPILHLGFSAFQHISQIHRQQRYRTATVAYIQNPYILRLDWILNRLRHQLCDVVWRHRIIRGPRSTYAHSVVGRTEFSGSQQVSLQMAIPAGTRELSDSRIIIWMRHIIVVVTLCHQPVISYRRVATVWALRIIKWKPFLRRKTLLSFPTSVQYFHQNRRLFFRHSSCFFGCWLLLSFLLCPGQRNQNHAPFPPFRSLPFHKWVAAKCPGNAM